MLDPLNYASLYSSIDEIEINEVEYLPVNYAFARRTGILSLEKSGNVNGPLASATANLDME